MSATVDACVQARLGNCPYGYYFNQVTWLYHGGTLTLQGHVATYYLKQFLQSSLRDVDHVEQIVNEVNVVSATGLSSESNT